MPKSSDKYFWDGRENTSGAYRLRRMLEYASFPDLIAYPFAEVRKYMDTIQVDALRTSEKRKAFIKLIQPMVSQSESWDDIFDRMLDT